MVTVEQVVTARDTLLATEALIDGQRILLLADPVHNPLLPPHLAALSSLDILDKQLTNLRSVSQLAACTESASRWTVGTALTLLILNINN